MRKALVVALVAVLAVGMTGLALSKGNYRIYFVDGSGTCIFGITSTGTVEPLLSVNFLDDIDLSFGGTGGGTLGPLRMEWTTADANANCGLIDLPTGGSVDVPVFLLASSDTDFGYFNGIVEPTLAVENLAGSSFIAMDFSATTLARLHAGGAATKLTLATDVAGAGIELNAADASANTAQQYVSITGSTPAHASGTPTDIFLDITPTLGVNTGTATCNLIDLTFTSPAWATGAATSTLRGVYVAPTIGAATNGTNVVALFDVAAITGDAQVSLYGMRFGALTGTGATENAIEIGSGWDEGINSASPLDIQAAITLANDEYVANASDGVVAWTGDDDTGLQLQVISADHDTTGDASLVLDADAGGDDADTWTITAQASGNDLSVINHVTEVLNLTTAGALQIDSTLSVDGGTIANATAAAGLTLDAADAAAGTGISYVTISGTTPAHATNTPTNIFLDVNPTLGLNTVATTTNLVDLTFTSPAWATGAITNTLRGVYFAPTIGSATNGTNTVALMDVAAITGDDTVSLYGIRMGALTGTAATEDAISIAAGWDAGLDSASPIVLTTATGDIDVQGEDITNTSAGGGLDFAATAAAAGTGTDFYAFEATTPAHTTNTPNDAIILLSPTLGLPTVANTVRFIESEFTLPNYATGAVTNDVDMWYIDPTIGDPTNGTNSFSIIEVAAIGDLDEQQNFYGIRFGGMTQEGGSQTAEAIVVGTGYDYGVNSDSNIKALGLVIDDGDADVTVDSDDQTDGSAAINIPDFTDATADFLVTNVFACVVPFHGGLAGEDTDGVGTNGAGLVGAGSIDVTTYDYNNGAAGANDVLCKVYDASMAGGTWDELATSATLDGYTAQYQLTPDADKEGVGDAFAIGFDERFCEFAFNDLQTNNGAFATWGGAGGKWQYSTGTGTWVDLTVFDNTDATGDGDQPLTQAGAISFAPPSNWAVATYDGEEAYWVQWVFTAAQLTQAAIIDDTNKDEPIIPFPDDGLAAPFKLTITGVRVTNMNATVHNQIIKFIVGNFTDGLFSNELTWTASQYSDTYTLSTTVACDADDVIGILCTDDTASTNNPIWAVELEVTYED